MWTTSLPEKHERINSKSALKRTAQGERIVMSEDEKDHPNHADEEENLTEEQREYIKEMIQKLMEKGIFVVYGDEDEKEKTIIFDDGGRKELCRAICCSFTFALTKKDVENGIVKWNPKRPYFIAKDEDGYCPHLDRETLMCKIWEDRPERCRNYDCRNEQNVWVEWEKKILNTDVFKHLPK